MKGDDLATIIPTEQEAVGRFVALLKEEQSALQQGDIDALGAIVERKTPLAAELDAIAGRRRAALEAAGLPVRREGVETWLSVAPEGAAARAAWRSLLALAAEARELNRVNGELIELRLRNNTQALQALLGAVPREELYGPDGRPAPPSGNRVIDAA